MSAVAVFCCSLSLTNDSSKLKSHFSFSSRVMSCFNLSLHRDASQMKQIRCFPLRVAKASKHGSLRRELSFLSSFLFVILALLLGRHLKSRKSRPFSNNVKLCCRHEVLHRKRRDSERHDQPKLSTAVQLSDSKKQSDLFTGNLNSSWSCSQQRYS